MPTKYQNIFKVLIGIVILVIILYLIKIIVQKAIYKIEYGEYVEKYSEEYGIDKELIYAIIKVESNFNKDAVSVSNAKGLMQIMYSTAEEVANQYGIELNEENILEPEINIEIGTIYISQLLEKYNNLELALAAYNAGVGNVDKWIEQEIILNDGSDVENIPFKETNMYVRKVIRDYKIYLEMI